MLGHEPSAHVKMSSVRQRMVIFSRSARSCSTSAGCPLSASACFSHSASYACRSPALNASSISRSHAKGVPSNTVICVMTNRLVRVTLSVC